MTDLLKNVLSRGIISLMAEGMGYTGDAVDDDTLQSLADYVSSRYPQSFGLVDLFAHPVSGESVCFSEWLPGKSPLPGDGPIAVDTETEQISPDPASPHPDMVIATAYSGGQGYYVTPRLLHSFLACHQTREIVCHNAAFDLGVLARCRQSDDVYQWADTNRVACTFLFERLLLLATEGESVRRGLSLKDLSMKYLEINLDKNSEIRTGFGDFKDQPIEVIPPMARVYAAKDAVVTLAVYEAQIGRYRDIRRSMRSAYGYPGEDVLDAAESKYGPLSLFVQVKASVLADAMSRSGIHVDPVAAADVVRECDRVIVESINLLRQHGLPIPLPGKKRSKSEKAPATAIQEYITKREPEWLSQRLIEKPVPRTPTGRIAVNRECQQDWPEDEILEAFCRQQESLKIRNTWAEKMQKGDTLHPQWNILLNTGRWSCSGDLALQTIPKQSRLRECIVPPPGHVFVAVDYATLEVVSLAAAFVTLGYGTSLATIIRDGQDIHRVVAASALNKSPEEVSKEERSSAKPITFGRPGGMSPTGIARIAKLNYGVRMSEEEAKQIVNGYHRLCPELDRHMARQGENLSMKCAIAIGLDSPSEGWDVLQLLEFGQAQRLDADVAWGCAHGLIPWLRGNASDRKKWVDDIAHRRPSIELRRAVQRGLDEQSSLTMTGRLRAKCSFTQSRNNIFQGPAADGGILALWRLWREGFKISLFIHDEIVVAVRQSDDVEGSKQRIIDIMQDEMSRTLAGLPVKTEAFVSSSFAKTHQDTQRNSSTPPPSEKATLPTLCDPVETSDDSKHAFSAEISAF